MPKVVVIEGQDAGKTFVLSGNTTVGRAPDCTVSLTDPNVFNRHIKISEKKDGYIVKDMSSLRALSVNGKAVSRSRLKQGDLIKIGKTVLIFSEDETIEVPDTVPEEERKAVSDPSTVRRKYISKSGPLMAIVDEPKSAKEKLLSLLKISQQISAMDSIPNIFEAILDAIFDMFPADRASIILYEEREKKFMSSASRVRGSATAPAKAPVSRGILKEIFKTQESLLILDAQQDRRFDQRQSVARQNIRSLMGAPLVSGEKFLGVLVVDSLLRKGAFSSEDLDMLCAIGYQTSMALENARLAEEVQEKALLEHEIELAGIIRRKVLPDAPPKRPDIELFGIMSPAQGVGGDFYDFIEKGDDLFIAVGDVSGRGMNSALVMMMTRSFLQPIVKMADSPREILAELNTYLVKDTIPGIVVRFLVVRWVPERERFYFCGTGLESFLLKWADTDEVEVIRMGGVGLGVWGKAGDKYVEENLKIGANDVFLLYTDGATEARNPRGETFGLNRLSEAFQRYASRPVKELVEGILGEIRAFSAGSLQRDDLTLVAARRKS
ncbi:MAG: SpoIIE family protein phosphatase [Planctomycetota bacterium]|jgi:serine phosphatase RsbU (regulator of sigma subunit)/pSer/pThr/pTyr-binding forkhead associated (FHA) protein